MFLFVGGTCVLRTFYVHTCIMRYMTRFSRFRAEGGIKKTNSFMEISSASLRIFFPVCGNILHYEVEGEKMDFDINFLFS